MCCYDKDPLLIFSGKKKDPGVPNSYPFKEQILQEAELRKQKVRNRICAGSFCDFEIYPHVRIPNCITSFRTNVLQSVMKPDYYIRMHI